MPRIFAPIGALALAAACLAACAGPSSGAGAGLALARPVLPAEQPSLYPGRVPSFLQVGTASWYGDRFKRRPTASGELFDPKDITAAHRTLPLGTIARVTNIGNGRSILVRINDRGPYAGSRVIDLSRTAASQLGMKQDGVAQVRVEVFAADQRPRTAALRP
jgi:peptidoglycan lytic transglycosylase